jgi:hypothetical protein
VCAVAPTFAPQRGGNRARTDRVDENVVLRDFERQRAREADDAIPLALHRAVRSHGGRGLSLLTNLILPGAMVQILLGIRTSVAYGWRALVASK